MDNGGAGRTPTPTLLPRRTVVSGDLQRVAGDRHPAGHPLSTTATLHEPRSFLVTGDLGFAAALISALGIASLGTGSVFGVQGRPIHAAAQMGHAGEEIQDSAGRERTISTPSIAEMALITESGTSLSTSSRV
jgi:hypothetical protein